ncbi:non-hydrolyzing UDP-N-acetylglucosamine 2-epimerase [Paralysiella testudinis]|uniref:UDP-N-acetylglucosamine 2-epimerase (non-hydrolyzing) n=1 Tax=Paralysiella testudinis TaxID=2809020 RepID=A0A892ZNK0_9NEIS|nr:UDP-N-acetylglucosamine 2-epimerase (non-hydrolyzing) [Paralysiella testudinis]QRQ83256.1 UDP-N-acetylglucosamine 2-epimerase (non-hydrolyzing) [Paralysiella testudinis]
MIVFGTRPEAIKMAALIRELKSYNEIELSVCVTGQHRDMLDQVLKLFNIDVDFDLNIMHKNQNLTSITTSILEKIEEIFNLLKPDLVLVHGDTSTTMATTLAAYYHKVKVGHIEAGLRTNNLYSPWPEEGNRKIVGCLADLHFAPTITAKINLLKEGIPEDKIFVTGNTVIDSLLIMQSINEKSAYQNIMQMQYGFLDNYRHMILITGHRRENFGVGFENICKAIRELAETYSDIAFVYPVHLNPNVMDPVHKALSKQNNIYLIEPTGYDHFVYLMSKSHIILTDSGGIQEEAPSLGKPVLVMRANTERPEAVDSGTVLLVGTDSANIVKHTSSLLNDATLYARMSAAHNPYGDGTASKKIADVILGKVHG